MSDAHAACRIRIRDLQTDRTRLADEVERLREALANVLFDPRKFRAAAHAILSSADHSP